MSEKREGALFYDKESGRYDIRFGLDSFYGGLHCGACLDLKVDNAWVMIKKADGMISGSVWIRITAGCTVGTALT